MKSPNAEFDTDMLKVIVFSAHACVLYFAHWYVVFTHDSVVYCLVHADCTAIICACDMVACITLGTFSRCKWSSQQSRRSV